LYIEAREYSICKEKRECPGNGLIKFTGSLGEVMKESGAIAHTCAKNFLATYFKSQPAGIYLDVHDVHVHLPEGATPKAFYQSFYSYLGRTICWSYFDHCFGQFSTQ